MLSCSRLITLAMAPFKIVHVNVAFTSFTGWNAAEVLGRDLHQLVKGDPIVLAALQTTSQSFCLSNLNGRDVLFAKNLETASVSKVSALPIEHSNVERPSLSSKSNELNRVTHFVVELRTCGRGGNTHDGCHVTSSPKPSPSPAPNATSRRHHRVVA